MPRIGQGTSSFDQPPPFQGFYDRVPVAAIQPPYCQRMINFNSDQGVVSYRHGDLAYIFGYPSAIYSLGLVAAGDQHIYLLARGTLASDVGIIDVTNTGIPAPAALGNLVGGVGATVTQAFGCDFSRYTFIFGVNNTTTVITGMVSISPTSALTYNPYTFSDVTFVPTNGYAYKSRLYIIGRSDFRLGFTNIGAIAGPVEVQDFADVFTKNGKLVAVRAVSISDNVAAQVFLLLISSSGEVVAYGGSYPNSSDWQIAGRFIISPPRSYDCIIDFEGDALIVTTNGIVSVRDLFLKGSQLAVDESITAAIQNRWKQLATSFTPNFSGGTPSMGGIWDATRNKIIVRFTQYVSYDGVVQNVGPLFLVYDISTKSWVEHTAGPSFARAAIALCYFNDNVYYTCDQAASVWIKEERTNYLDNYVLNPGGGNTSLATALYPFHLISAPIINSNVAQKIMTAFQFITKTDFNPNIEITLLGNFGNSGEQVTGVVKLPTQGTGVRASLVSVGMNASFVQWQIYYPGNATSPTVGYSLYAISTLYSQGGIG